MKHEILIYKTNKKTKSTFIDAHIFLTEEDIEEMVLKKYKEKYDIDEYDEEEYEYEAHLDQTTH